MKLGERLLRAVSRSPDAADYPAVTLLANLDNALDFLDKTVPGFLSYIRGNAVLDYGCGWGWQAVAMVKAGARSVFGLEIVPESIQKARDLARQHNVYDRVTISDQLPNELLGTFDIVLSCSSFEHFSDPAGILDHMADIVRPGGRVIISFGEPWYSPYGSHMSFFTKVPWVNLLWSEATVMKVRGSYRNDGATRYEDVQGGLNRMTLAKFEHILAASRLKLEWMRYYPTKRLPLVHKLPVIRELLTSAAASV
jgi:SAM-dependent methyltransferase